VRAYADDPGDRDDLLQEIWFALWRALPRYRGESSLRTFVYRIAHNRAITFNRRAFRSRGVEIPDELADPAPDPAAAAVSTDLSERLAAAILRLGDPHRETVVLHLEGLSPAEIADVQGTTAGNVAVRLTRARAALRRDLADDSRGGTG
jgi:RNA polymerase sigma-70 factor (ECF subfamily)